MQTRALREYATRRGWTIALQVKEIGSGASQRERREQLLEAARRREIDVVLVWRLDRWGRSVTDLLATLQELEHLGVGFVSLTEALDLTTPAGRAMAALLAVFAEFEREILRERVRAGLAHARQNGQRLGRPANGSPPRRPGTEALPCGHQQIRNRPPVADRAYLRAPHSERKVGMMTKPSTEYHKIWVEQCAATEDIRERFGLESALDYLIGEKLFSFVAASEQDPLFAQELPDFVAEIRRLFTPAEIRAYLGHLERTKFLAPPEPDLDRDDLDEEDEEEPWPAHPVVGAQELLRYSRVRQLLQD